MVEDLVEAGAVREAAAPVAVGNSKGAKRMTAEEFLTNLDDARIAEAIRLAETTTSGEIRVFVSRHPSDQPLEDAKREFHRLGMEATGEGKAVLV